MTEHKAEETWEVSGETPFYSTTRLLRDGLPVPLAVAATRLNALQQQVRELAATVERQRIWAQVGMKGKAEDDRENADKLVAINQQVTELEGKAALADEIFSHDGWIDWQKLKRRYDALSGGATIAQEEQR